MSAIFEFDFIEPKPTTKVDSVFDLVNGNGQHHEEAELTRFETKLLGKVQEANERIEEFIAESASQIAPPWDEAPNLTPKDLLEGYSPANHRYHLIDAETKEILTSDPKGLGLIVVPDDFDFDDDINAERNEPEENEETKHAQGEYIRLLFLRNPSLNATAREIFFVSREDHPDWEMPSVTKRVRELKTDERGRFLVSPGKRKCSRNERLVDCYELNPERKEKLKNVFEFTQSETLDYNETPEIPAATTSTSTSNVFAWDDEEDEEERKHQANLRKWERDYEQAKIDWERTKRNTEQEQVALALEVKRISDELKEVRQQHKSVISTLEDLHTTGPDYPERPIKGQDPQPPKPPAEPAPSGKPAKKQPNVDESWKKIKAETFLSLEIEGMGQKKLDILLHEYPTLGDWVELQTEASKKCIHLSKLLPKGVGKKLADSIDNAAMDAFRDHVPQEANT